MNDRDIEHTKPASPKRRRRKSIASRRAFLKGFSAASLASLTGCAAPFGSQQSYLTQYVGAASVNAIHFWTDVALQAVRDQLMPPPLTTRGLAMGHVAGFLAANSAQPKFGTEISARLHGIDPEVAYGAAFSAAIAEHFQQPFVFDRSRFFNFFPDSDAKTRAIAFGDKVGQYVVANRTNDGAEPSKVNFYLNRYPRREDVLRWSPTGPFYDAGEGPAFRPTFARGLLPGFGAVKPWTMASPEQFGAEPFLDPRSPEFAEQFAEVKALGGSKSHVRTPDQSQISVFWEDGPWGASPPGHFTLIAMQILQNTQLSFVDLARAFALMSMAQADSAIAVWHSKFHYDVIRPETAIRFRANAFGNSDPRVQTDPSWKSYIPTPPFPSYVSGHSAFGASAMRVLEKTIGTNNVTFEGPAADPVIWPKHLAGVRRRWTSLWQAAEENGLSRIYGGVHWRIDNDVALRMGREIADHVVRSQYPALV